MGMLSWSAYEYVLEWKYGIECKHLHWIGGTLLLIDEQ